MAGDATLAGSPRASFGAFLAHYRSRWPLYLTQHLGFGLHICFGYVITDWLPVTFLRDHHMPHATAGLAFGPALLTLRRARSKERRDGKECISTSIAW